MSTKQKKLPKEDDVAPIGHNKAGGVAADQLKSILERIENLMEEKAGLAADIRDVFAEAKGNGFDVKTLRRIIKLRAMESSERAEQAALLETYGKALGEEFSFL
jgi:uncharacterized protein (UPF0335 family)